MERQSSKNFFPDIYLRCLFEMFVRDVCSRCLFEMFELFKTFVQAVSTSRFCANCLCKPFVQAVIVQAVFVQAVFIQAICSSHLFKPFVQAVCSSHLLRLLLKVFFRNVCSKCLFRCLFEMFVRDIFSRLLLIQDVFERDLIPDFFWTKVSNECLGQES